MQRPSRARPRQWLEFHRNRRARTEAPLVRREIDMNEQTKRRPYAKALAWVVPPLILIGAWFSVDPGFHWRPWPIETSNDAFGQRVRGYLLEHPEVITEAINRLEARQAAEQQAQARTNLKAHAEQVFRDPRSPVGGNPQGDATLVEFFDYNCPYCRQMVPLMTQAEAEDSGLRVVYKEFPILGPGSLFAAKAALAADRQGKYEAFHRALYQVRGSIDEGKALAASAAPCLDLERLKTDMADAAIEAQLKQNAELAQVLQITGTPGFVVGDHVLTGATDLKTIQSLINETRKDAAATK